MNYYIDFLKMMEESNYIARTYGFDNIVKWADAALELGEMSYEMHQKCIRVRHLRNELAFDNGIGVNVSLEDYQIAQDLATMIRDSAVRNK